MKSFNPNLFTYFELSVNTVRLLLYRGVYSFSSSVDLFGMQRFSVSTYHIKNKGSDQYLIVAKNSSKLLSELLQGPRVPPTRVNCVWFTCPINGGGHLVINKKSLLAMSVTDNSRIPGAGIQLNIPHEDGENSWLIEPDQYSNCFRLKSVASSLYLCVSGRDPNSVRQWHLLESGPERDSQLWHFELKASFPSSIPPFVHEMTLDQLYDLGRTFTMDEELYGETAEVLMGLVEIPSLMIAYGARDGLRHILRRYCCWRCSYFLVNEKPVTDEKIVTVGGVAHRREDEVKLITGIQICHNGRFYLDGPIKLCGDAIAQRLQVKLGEEQTFPLDRYSRYQLPQRGDMLSKDSLWHAQDRYVLSTSTGVGVMEWASINVGIRVFQRCVRLHAGWMRVSCRA